jgi:MYXO-CTERM domain-containing protein
LSGGGAALTALLSLLAAFVRRPQHHDRQPLTVTDVTPRDREEAGKHLVAAGQR